jgi:Kyakuja-Dileera-Zisupton transposase
VDGSGHSDECVFVSNYFSPNNFKDDVATPPRIKAQPVQALPHGNEDSWCTKHWTAANTVSKGMVQVFQQTGGFLATCCHSIVETLMEMQLAWLEFILRCFCTV